MRLPCLCVLISITFACASDQTSRKTGILTIAVAGDTVFIGRSKTFGVYGTFHIRSLEPNPIDCKGRFKYHNPPRGRARFSYSNQESGTVKMESDGGLQGFGSGKSTLGPVQLVFGYLLAQANRRLNLPEGKTLTIVGSGILLEDVSEK